MDNPVQPIQFIHFYKSRLVISHSMSTPRFATVPQLHINRLLFFQSHKHHSYNVFGTHYLVSYYHTVRLLPLLQTAIVQVKIQQM